MPGKPSKRPAYVKPVSERILFNPPSPGVCPACGQLVVDALTARGEFVKLDEVPHGRGSYTITVEHEPRQVVWKKDPMRWDNQLERNVRQHVHEAQTMVFCSPSPHGTHAVHYTRCERAKLVRDSARGTFAKKRPSKMWPGKYTRRTTVDQASCSRPAHDER